MLVATFGPKSAWPNKKVVWDPSGQGHFVIEEHGAISAAKLLEYGRSGELTWASPTSEEFAEGAAEREAGREAAGESPGVAGGSQSRRGGASGRAGGSGASRGSQRTDAVPRSKMRMLMAQPWARWALGLLAVLILLLVSGRSAYGVYGCSCTPPPAPPSAASTSSTGTPTVTATLTGPDTPASAGLQAFCDNMVKTKTKVFAVTGVVTITPSITPDVSDGSALVEGFLVPANFPIERVQLDLTAPVQQFDLTGHDWGTSWTSEGLTLQGDYYVMAAGRNCRWSLTVTQQ